MKYFISLLSLALIVTSCSKPVTQDQSQQQTPEETPVVEDQNEQVPAVEDQVFTAEEVTTHNSKSSCWTIIDGKVYDLTSAIYDHRGGPDNILKLCGIDGTEMFMGKHGKSEHANADLAELYIGDVESAEQISE